MVESFSADEPVRLLAELCDLVADRVPAEREINGGFEGGRQAAEKNCCARQRRADRSLPERSVRGRDGVRGARPPDRGEVRCRARRRRGAVRGGPRGDPDPLRGCRERRRPGAAGRPLGGHHDCRGGHGGLRAGIGRRAGGVGHPLARVAGHRAAGGGVAAAARPMAALPRPGLQCVAAGASSRAAIHQGPGTCPRAVPRVGRPESVAFSHRLLADDGDVLLFLGPARVSGRLPAGLARSAGG